jgi:hypothetical protein
MLRKTIIINMCLIASLGCSGKKQNVVSDKGPQINSSSLDLALDGISDKPVELKRAEDNFGPQINFMPQSNDGTALQSKRLICGPKTVEGRDLSQSPNPFSFRIAEEDFPGLKTLPKKLSCSLEVVFQNNIGSTLTKVYPLSIHYDTHPALEITRAGAAPYGLNQLDGQGGLTIDYYHIKNTLDYPVGFVYRNRKDGFVQIMGRAYNPQNQFAQLFPQGDRFSIHNTEPAVLTGDFIYIDGNYVDSVKFQIKPGGTVDIRTHYNVPVGPFPPGCSLGGVFVHSIVDVGGTALVQWNGFEFDPSDLTQ